MGQQPIPSLQRTSDHPFVGTMSTPEDCLRAMNLDEASKKAMIDMCKALGLPHGGLKASVEARIRAHRASLPPTTSAPVTTTAATQPSATAPGVLPPALHTITASTGPIPSPPPSRSPLHTPSPELKALRPRSRACTQPPGSHNCCRSHRVEPPSRAQRPPYHQATHLRTASSLHKASRTQSCRPTAGQAVDGSHPTYRPLPSRPLSKPLPKCHPNNQQLYSHRRHQAWDPHSPPPTHGSTNPLPPPLNRSKPCRPCTLQHGPYQPVATASNIMLAPLNSHLPPMPAKFMAAAAAGEFVDFNELLHAIEVDSGEEPPLCIQVGEGQQLTLPRKPKRQPISTLGDWVKCFAVYASTLTANRGPDMFAYLYLIAAAHKEFHFTAGMAYDTAFWKKASQFRLTTWGQIDRQLYSRASTGAGKAKAGTLCALCLSTAHVTSDCPLYSRWPAKKPKLAQAGPKGSTSLKAFEGKEVCLNYNRGRCSRDDCPRAHVCSVKGCQGQHTAAKCPRRRLSPRKP